MLALCLSLLAVAAGPIASVAQQPLQPLAAPKAPEFSPKGFGGQGKGKGVGSLPKRSDKAQPLYLEGDQLIYDTKGSRVIARGNVQIYYDNNILTADEVIYDQGAGTLTAVGNVTLKDPNGQIVRADRYTLTDDFRDGFVQSLSVVSKDDTRISAERAVRRDASVTEFTNGKFTPCKSDSGMPPLWCIGAARIVHDQQNATITYQDAQFELFGVPILYLPYFQHPDPTVKRRSGFLIPEQSSSTNLGQSVEVPYYWAIAQNYDLTFHPRYMSKQGVLWQGDWRHRLANGQYTIKLAGINQDATNLPSTTTNREALDGWRGSAQSRGQFSLSDWWSFGWDGTIESDDTFRRFYKLDGILQTDRVNTAYLQGLSDRNYFGARLFHFGGLLLNDTPTAESRTHPIIDHNYIVGDPVLGGELSFDTNALSFSRDDALNNRRRTDINKVTSEVKWRRRLTDAVGITYTPFANLRGDVYQLSNVVDPTTGLLVEEDTVTRGLASGGATVSYPWIAAAWRASHIIEPIGQVVVRQESVTQRRMPDEDARSLVFDDTNLFELRKFSGYDRLETGTRANVGLQYTFQANSGATARVLAGQSFHLSGDNAYQNPGRDADGNFVFSPKSGLQTDRSDYVLGLYLAPSSVFRFISQTRLGENDFDVRREDAFAQVAYGPLIAQAAYSFTAADPELGIDKSQQDLYSIVGLKLTDRWSVLGSLRYDLDAKNRIQDILQLRYADECFVLTATYTETFVNNVERDLYEDRTLMLRFELKNIGEFKYRTDVLDHVFADNQPQVGR